VLSPWRAAQWRGTFTPVARHYPQMLLALRNLLLTHPALPECQVCAGPKRCQLKRSSRPWTGGEESIVEGARDRVGMLCDQLSRFPDLHGIIRDAGAGGELDELLAALGGEDEPDKDQVLALAASHR
jgi:hypothetical protein